MSSENIECPHCLVAVHVEWHAQPVLDVRHRRYPLRSVHWNIVATECPSCDELIARINEVQHLNAYTNDTPVGYEARKTAGSKTILEDRLVHPSHRNRPAVDSESLPQTLKEDYLEACEVLEISPKASAVLSRRVLQGILKEQGYDSRNLQQQITDVLEEDGPEALSDSLRATIDVIRHFGNFSAHPIITQETTLQLVDVEPDEAEWCLQIVEELFRHYYVEADRRRKRIEETRAKIKAHGKELLPKQD